jgi:hypothetical protein
LIEGKKDSSEDFDRFRRLREIKPRRSGEGTAGLHEYYLNREISEATFCLPFQLNQGGQDWGMMYFQKLSHLIGSTLFDPYREKVTEEMLLCELMLQRRICKSHINNKSAYKDAIQQNFEKLVALGRQLPKDFFDIQVSIFHDVYLHLCQNDRVDEGIALGEEMYTRICEESGLADPVLQSVVADMAGMLSTWGNDVDRAGHWALVAADNLRSYIRDSDPFRYCREGCTLAMGAMAVIIGKTASEERKEVLYQEAEGLLYDIISKSEEHFGADSFEVGYALTGILML